MTLLEAIHSRHSVRKFIDKPIEEDIERIDGELTPNREQSSSLELPRCELAEWPVASDSESEGCKAQGRRPKGQLIYSEI